jgi:hypothetical protein
MAVQGRRPSSYQNFMFKQKNNYNDENKERYDYGEKIVEGRNLRLN